MEIETKAEWVDGADYIFETEMQDDFTTDFDTDFKGEYSKEASDKYWRELHEKCLAWHANETSRMQKPELILKTIVDRNGHIVRRWVRNANVISTNKCNFKVRKDVH